MGPVRDTTAIRGDGTTKTGNVRQLLPPCTSPSAPVQTLTRHDRGFPNLFVRPAATDTISPLLGSLISLIRLSLGHNKLSGSIPDSLGNLIHLRYFSVEHNRLTGPVSAALCNMTALETFNVSNNELCGAIPERIGALSRLRKLDFSSNRLSGSIPAGLGDLSGLNWLFLDHNRLTGPVPASFGNLRELLIVDLAFNRLTGPMPAALAFLSDLTTVSLRGNSFEGPFQFPSKYRIFGFSTATSGMRRLDLGSNEVDEAFPDLSGMRQLQSLALDSNRIYGGLGERLAETCRNLFNLNLRNNRLTGEVGTIFGLTAPCPSCTRLVGCAALAKKIGPAISTFGWGRFGHNY